MPQNPNAQVDSVTLDLIEHNATGSVPATPSFQDSILRLISSHQIYANADFKGGYVTARSLAGKVCFIAKNLKDVAEHKITPDLLESNNSIFDRYLISLNERQKNTAEPKRALVAGKVAHHRAKWVGDKKIVDHDPIHSLFLVPGCGKHVGLPGNYLYGMLFQVTDQQDSPWNLHLHDTDDGLATCTFANLKLALDKLDELVASAPFTLSELTALDFKNN